MIPGGIVMSSPTSVVLTRGVSISSFRVHFASQAGGIFSLPPSLLFPTYRLQCSHICRGVCFFAFALLYEAMSNMGHIGLRFFSCVKRQTGLAFLLCAFILYSNASVTCFCVIFRDWQTPHIVGWQAWGNNIIDTLAVLYLVLDFFRFSIMLFMFRLRFVFFLLIDIYIYMYNI